MTTSYSLYVTRAIFVVVLLGTATITVLGQQTAARPDRGVMPNGSYSVSDIENISLENGNVNLSIPLASLPPVAGGKLSWTISAHYNSKVWDITRTELDADDEQWRPYVVDNPQISDRGGWRITGQYSIEIRPASWDFEYAMPPSDAIPYNEYQLLVNYNWYKVVLIMPDGAEHELRPVDYSSAADGTGLTFLHGYYNISPYTQSPMRYYSFDGSYLYATINTNATSWTVYLPDGTTVVQTTDGIQRVQDTNGNKIKIYSDSNGTHYQDEQTGREIRYDGSKVWYQTVGGDWKTIDLVWDTTNVQGKVYRVNGWIPSQINPRPCIHHSLINTEMQVIREIVLPLTEPGQTQRRFTFSYNSDTTESATHSVQWGCSSPSESYTRQASKGWGSLSRMVTPSGATIDYSYRLDSGNPFAHLPMYVDDIPAEPITQKKVTHDGTFGVWNYSVLQDTATMTGPDGGTVEERKYSHTPGYGFAFGKAGLVYRSTRPFIRIDRHWSDVVFSGASTNSPGGPVNFNPVIDAEYTTLLDASNNPLKMSAKTFQYDYNGNLLQTTEYDWFDPALVFRDTLGVPTGVPGSATVLRTTSNSYYNPATSSSSGNVYAKRSMTTGLPLILNALQQTTTGPAIAQFRYDTNPYGTAPTIGNLTSKSVWDDLDSKWITTSYTYGLYGNLATSTDGRGKVTTFGYLNPALGLPASVTVDPQNGTGTQITTTEYDYYTGLVTATIDVNGKRSEINYMNQLLGAIDPFGRPGVVIGPDIGGGVNHLTTTTYIDNARQVVVATDLNAEGDKLVKTRTTSDELGRPVLTEHTEDGTNYTITAQKAYDAVNNVTYASNPRRSASAATDGWTRTKTDTAGRVTEVARFSGTSQPPASGTNGNWTGSVTTSYSSNEVTVTDQAGRQRKSVSNALGQLTSVFEDPNGLNYQTSYDYDALGNLRHVYQGTQTRTFTYDSLSRLRTAVNPESGTITYAYDDNGNLTSKTDARSITTTFVYDSLNRATSRSYSDGTPAVTYVYDTLAQNGKGRLTSVSSSVSTYSYSGYDAMGRVTGAIQTIGAQTYTITNVAYDLAGHLKTMTYPSGRTVTNSYDNAGRLSSFSGNLGDGGSPRTYANDFQYTALNGLQQEKFGTTTPIYHKQRFNSRGQLWDMRASTVSFATDPANGDRGAIVNYYSNTFTQGGSGSDNNGNLLRQENYIPGSSFFQDTFTYDSLNRLTSIAEKLNGTGTDSFKQVYVYDRWGNRTIDQVNTTPNVPKPNFGVNTSNNRLTAPAGYTMGYDTAGNLTNDTYAGEGARTYDAENRMKQAWANGQWQTYTYDGDGRRIKRNVNGTETWQVYGIGGELLAEYPVNGAAATPQKEYGYRKGELLVTAETSSGGGGGSSAQPVTWTNAVGISVSGNNLTKTAADGWGNAGASSTQSIASGDGYVETTISETNKYRMVGLSNGDSHQNYDDIDFALYPAVGGTLYIYEGGVSKGTFGTYATGDVLRVAVEGGVVKYRKNGTLLYTSTVSPTYPLLVDTALYTNGSTISNVVISGASGGGGSANVKWLVSDHLGTPRMIFDQTGSLANVSRHDYLPFGEELYAGAGGRSTGQGYTSSDNVRQKFTLKERDNETGLDYFLARYYSSTQGRFTSADPILITPDRQKLPQLLNLYSYVGNNPLAYQDPTGMERIRLGRPEAEIQAEIDTVSEQLAQNEASTPEEHQALIEQRQSLVTELEGTQVANQYLAALDSIGERQGLQLSDFTLSTDSANDFAGIPGINGDPLAGAAMGVIVGYSREIFVNTNSREYQVAIGHQPGYDNQGNQVPINDMIKYLGTAAVHERSHRDSPTRDLRLSEGRAYTEQLRVLQKFGVNAFKTSSFFYFTAGHVMNGSEGIFGW